MNFSKNRQEYCPSASKVKKHYPKLLKNSIFLLYTDAKDFVMKAVINIFCFLIPFPKMRRRVRNNLKNKWQANKNNLGLFKRYLTGQPIILWVDHALGGGTEVYSKRQFKILKKDYDVIRLQYFPRTELYHITMADNKNHIFTTRNMDLIFDFCTGLGITEIVVNNLVAYKNTLEVLKKIKELKQQCVGKPSVSFRGHDFQAICPSFNLINCDGKYCAVKYNGGCEKCWRRKKLSDDPISHNVLKSGADKICVWRQVWGDFFANVADDVILFSGVIEKIFAGAYPQIKSKVRIIPHSVRLFRKVNVKPHTDINIAVLGNISHNKGANVVCEMAKNIPENANIIVVGTMKGAPKNITVHGAYKQNRLPQIMEKHRIDLVLIPSIWPETFSYTTSEAISMGLAVACYGIGAPAERVEQYDKGLVLDKISPDENLTQIINFVKRLRENAQ